jgi:SAM-dependent methyltransferase
MVADAVRGVVEYTGNVVADFRIPRINPRTGNVLEVEDDALVDTRTGEVVAPIVEGIARFVTDRENYAESFGWQWKRWADARSDSRNPGYNQYEIILERTHFGEYDLDGRTLLECGMGGGDDTEALLRLPFAEIHSFDISTAVERAAQNLVDERLLISQASILDIPYPDRAFDFVFCHRVLQHTPDPRAALRRICRKVRKGGILFAHSYKRSWVYMMEWRYKYRWLGKRLSWKLVHAYVDRCGPGLHRLVQLMYRTRVGAAVAYTLVPFYHVDPEQFPRLSAEQLLEMAQHVTFDALTPRHDHPMASRTFRSIIESEGFRIEHLHDPLGSPIYCTATRL